MAGTTSKANIGLAPPGLGKSLEVQILAAEHVLRSGEPVLLITPGDQDNLIFALGDDGDTRIRLPQSRGVPMW